MFAPLPFGLKSPGRYPLKVKIVRVGPVAFLLVHGAYQGHVVLTERKIEQLRVADDAFPGGGLDQGGYAALQVPAQNDLGRPFIVLFGQFGNHRILEQGRALPSERAPGLADNTLAAAIFKQRFLAQMRMALYLVDRRDDLGIRQQFVKMMGLQIGHPDGVGPARGVNFLQPLP